MEGQWSILIAGTPTAHMCIRHCARRVSSVSPQRSPMRCMRSLHSFCREGSKGQKGDTGTCCIADALVPPEAWRAAQACGRTSDNTYTLSEHHSVIFMLRTALRQTQGVLDPDQQAELLLLFTIFHSANNYHMLVM